MGRLEAILAITKLLTKYGSDSIGFIFATVSYTHLDVYKRQLWHYEVY